MQRSRNLAAAVALVSSFAAADTGRAADRYWVVGSGNWSDPSHWSATSGGASGETVPTAVDEVFFDGNSGAGTCTLDGAATIMGLTLTSGYAGAVDTDGAQSYAVTIGGDLSISGGNFYARGSTIVIPGNFVASEDTTHFEHGTSTVIMSGTGTINMNPGGGGQFWRNDFYNLEVAPAGLITTLASSFEVRNSVKFNGGEVTDGANSFAINFTGDPYIDPLSIAAGTTMSFSEITFGGPNTARTVTVPSFQGYPRLTLGVSAPGLSVTLSLAAGGLTCTSCNFGRGTFDQNGEPLTTGTITGAHSAGSETVWNSGGGSITVNGAANFASDTSKTYNWSGSVVDINGDVTITSILGTINMGDSTWTVSGDWSNTAGGAVDPGTSTVTFDGASAQSVTAGGSAFYEVEVANTVSAVTFADAQDITTLTANAATADVSITFKEGVTHLIDSLSLTGSGANHIVLRSADSGVDWGLATIGTQVVNHVDVARSDASASANPIDATDPSNVDSGNNTNWDFGAGVPPGAFNLLAPADTATDVSPTPKLDWEDSTGATTYTLVVADNASFVGPIINNATLVASEYTASPGALAEDTQYFWKVTAVNASGSTPATGNDFTFTTRAVGHGWLGGGCGAGPESCPSPGGIVMACASLALCVLARLGARRRPDGPA